MVSLIEDQIVEVFWIQKSSLSRLKNTTHKERIDKLRSIEKYMISHKKELFDALYDDFKKPSSEVILAELLGVKREIDHICAHLKSWMKPQKVDTPLLLLGTQGYVQMEAKGMCLIIAPWNYPFNLAICPLLLAIAAGNAVMLKPSELSPATSTFIKKMITSLFDRSEVAVFEGDAAVSTCLLDQKFDHIFFTGSPMIGKLVMKAAAEHLTSVTLELGGKSPAIIGPHADIEASAQKIAWGKFLNNGQTCIAPDYVYVHEKHYFAFLEALEKSVNSFYNPDKKGVQQSKDYARIVNSRHFSRIMNLVEDAKLHGANVLFGGDTDEQDCFIAPMVLTNCHHDMKIMQEEIFGPILPILVYKDEQEIIDKLAREEKPLALYIFSENEEFTQHILKNTSSGGVVVNDCLIHYGHGELPFGGVNNSGIGKTGGKYGFIEFSNQKSVLIQHSRMMKFLYPPYQLKVRWMLDFILKWL
ncbi:aldehyde dehydrogenase family protein [Aquirufa nivalisilvae]|uniref:aldehyde dehydrogenase family protein n=1 Tax=Aquirufa nivalisilvae TaxID=2516557 RepID=UPI0022A9DADD|nr:aldehyde dehydrogenase family protein [Aquirufa nivalisilvae]MCZ2480163.1 aldehyde dehydrogenase family protein [Aquirufa nivalisilvae]